MRNLISPPVLMRYDGSGGSLQLLPALFEGAGGVDGQAHHGKDIGSHSYQFLRQAQALHVVGQGVGKAGR